MTLHWNKDVIEACKKGDRRAQQSLYNLYKDAMYNVAFRMLANRHDAEDILVSSFADIFRSIHSFDYRATPGAWIKRIVINNAISHLKKKRAPLLYVEHLPDQSSRNHQIDVSPYDMKLIKKVSTLYRWDIRPFLPYT